MDTVGRSRLRVDKKTMGGEAEYTAVSFYIRRARLIRTHECPRSPRVTRPGPNSDGQVTESAVGIEHLAYIRRTLSKTPPHPKFEVDSQDVFV
jgi:hypothetical protein